MPDWETIEGNIATPSGFRAAALAAGIKKVPGALDLAMIFSECEATTAAGVFTTNRAAAAPVVLSRFHLAATHGRARAVVVNAGNANAATGRAGLETAEEIAQAAAKLLGVPAEQVLVASTGVIGLPLKLELIAKNLPALKQSLSVENAGAVAQAIMTTDTVPKCCVLRSQRGGKAAHLAGIAKGAGMIHPRLATMLCFITTDAAVHPRILSTMLNSAVVSSFNRISVDGDTSTNDTVLILASGASGLPVRPSDETHRWFVGGLRQLCQTLAKMIVRDGEGAKKLVTIEVTGARSPGDAERVARAIANSALVKTAIAGSDPNWGRILCAAGYSGAKIDPARIDIRINDFDLCRRGLDAGFDEAEAKRQLDWKELTLRVDLHVGSHATTFWTCDLTHDYIDINASYRT